ncbi:MAG: XisI protein [Chloroflexi bacterium]|uniref:element excision factor XisI family protein n=1 Tax=Candidatus Flexifilum breve TaxID=3140694 RepID=UPI0031363321|nr:XisI protein [Chloroflexota bacterium]
MATVEFSKTGITMQLAATTRVEINRYAGNTFDGRLVACLDDDNLVYSVIAVPDYPRSTPIDVVVMAQVTDERIIIIEDRTDKPLVEALMVNAKIPREQIVLEYAGEKLPEQTKGE